LLLLTNPKAIKTARTRTRKGAENHNN